MYKNHDVAKRESNREIEIKKKEGLSATLWLAHQQLFEYQGDRQTKIEILVLKI